MEDFLWHFILGLLVSFLGSIPLGTVNLAVIQTTININFRAGFYFALGATLIELIYSAIAIKFIALLLNNTNLDIVIQIISVPAFLVLGIIYFRKEEAVKFAEEKKTKSFYNGIFVGLINPLQIPFWIAYGSLLLSKNWIRNDDILLDVFIMGICTGTLLVLTLIAFVSKSILSRIDIQAQMVNKIIGAILIILSLYQLFRVSLHFI
jgi:threonine/homoserine/homoserine lactone efflux protein